MTGNRGAFASYNSLNPNISVNPTHGHKGRPIGIGSVNLQLEGGELTLENVKHTDFSNEYNFTRSVG
jgi:hypothetical protein